MSAPGPARLQGGLLHLDCSAGIAGDMFVAAALDLGVPRAALDEALGTLGIALAWQIEPVLRGGLRGLKVRLSDEASPHAHQHGREHGPGHGHRPWRDIRALLSRLPAGVRARAEDMFGRIARVEAHLHGVAVDDVAFHEVGALDSIFDLVAAAAALDWLAPARTSCARVTLGSGEVRAGHGRLPVPAPATVELLRGAPVEAGGVPCELTTPTGAAILAATVDAWEELRPQRLEAVGYGAGERELPDRPNLLRLIAGSPLGGAAASAAQTGPMALLEANLDDMSPQLCEPLMEALFAAGAVDVWFTPIHMKKSRPAFLASALAPPEAEGAVTRAFLRESTTLGVRRSRVERSVLERRIETVETPFGPIEVKLALEEGRILRAAPEYESVRRQAALHQAPVQEVFAAALAAAAARRSWPGG